MTTETRPMPDLINHAGIDFWRTRWTGTTLDRCPFGPDLPCFEYWAEGYGDAVRLYAISPTQFWSDDV
jgi:hypothetical protein